MTPTRRAELRAARRAAKAPARRHVTAKVPSGPFAGWEATATADFPARLLAELQSGQVDRIVAALSTIVTDHNMPDAQGEIAADLADVVPWDGLVAVVGPLLESIQKLPNR